MDNGINTVNVSLVRERTGHALIGARQWIPREQIADPVTSLLTGLPLDLRFRTKGQLAMDACADCYADGLSFDFACGDEVYGSCTQLREFFEEHGQAYVLRVASNFTVTLAPGTKADAVKRLLKDKRRWEVGSAGQGSRGERWCACAWIAAGSPRHHLLVRRPLLDGGAALVDGVGAVGGAGRGAVLRDPFRSGRGTGLGGGCRPVRRFGAVRGVLGCLRRGAWGRVGTGRGRCRRPPVVRSAPVTTR